MRIKLMVVDDHPLVRHGVAMCLANHTNIEVVGGIGDAREVVAKAREWRPDVVLMDISMPCMNGLEATSLLHRELPEIKVLILSIYENPEYLRQAIQAGAHGYILKSTTIEKLVRAIEAVYQGESHFDSDAVRLAFNQFTRADKNEDHSRLTRRESEVLVLIAEGSSNKEIAAKLGVSTRTVESHREHLMQKLNVHTAAGLARFAVAKGYVSDGGTPAYAPLPLR